MTGYQSRSRSELEKELSILREQFEGYKKRGVKLDMSRGKPSSKQLNITDGLLSVLNTAEDCYDATGFDCRNYGLLDGIPEAKQLFGELLGVSSDEIIIGGNSSLTLMYDAISKGMTHGFPEGGGPWMLEKKRKFLCPVPGYDRHFSITETFGFEMLNIPMKEDGPDMDLVERLVSSDDTIKGIWCVPKYSNPEGKTYSNEVVKRFATLKPAAKDFKILWDNAYAIHEIYDEGDELLNILDECKKQGTEDRVLIFSSTSKISYPGAGVSMMAGSRATIEYFKKLMFAQTISYDKLNSLRHVRYFKTVDGIREHMKKHAAVLRPKFELVLNRLDQEIAPLGIASWVKPRGGYFVSLDTMPGCAKRTVALLKEAGVAMTPAGATYPYGRDPRDVNIRIAPTYPPLEELDTAMKFFCCALKIAAIEKMLER